MKYNSNSIGDFVKNFSTEGHPKNGCHGIRENAFRWGTRANSRASRVFYSVQATKRPVLTDLRIEQAILEATSKPMTEVKHTS